MVRKELLYCTVISRHRPLKEDRLSIRLAFHLAQRLEYQTGLARMMRKGYAIWVVALGLFWAACTPKPESIPLQAEQLSQWVEPGTAIVKASTVVQITVPRVRFKPDALQQAVQQRMPEVQSLSDQYNQGQLSQVDFENQVIAICVNELIGNLSQYLTIDGAETMQKSVTSQGSGFFVSDSGMLVTNAHVVALNKEEIKVDALKDAFKNVIVMFADSIASFKAGMDAVVAEKLDQQIAAWLGNEDNQKEFISKLLDFAKDDVQVENNPIDVKVIDVSQNPDNDSPATELSGEVKYVGEPTPGKDVALIRVEGSGFHTLPLSDDDLPPIGDTIRVSGFPGDSTFNEQWNTRDKDDKITGRTIPTLSEGQVKSTRQFKGALWKAIMTSAIMHHGNSGGPVIDGEGKVCGIATFIGHDEAGIKEEGSNFAIPTSVIREMLVKNGVELTQSQVSIQHREALHYMAGSQFSKAKEILQPIAEKRPNDRFIKAELALCEKRIREGKDSTPNPLLLPLAAIACGVVFIGIAGIVAVTSAKKKRAGMASSVPQVNPAAHRAQPPFVLPKESAPVQPHPAVKKSPVAGIPPAVATLVLGMQRVPLTLGLQFDTRLLPQLSPQAGNLIAEVVANPQNESQLGLKNLSMQSWEYISVDGSKQKVEPGRTAPIRIGSSVQLGPVIAKFEPV